MENVKTKVCRACGNEKSVDLFYNEGRMADGKASTCKRCMEVYRKAWEAKNPEKVETYRVRNQLYHKVLYAATKTKRKIIKRRLQYSLSEEQFISKLASQNGSCEICKTVLDSSSGSKVPHVDHDHNCCAGERACTKCVRGLLCRECNFMLGNAKENVDTLEGAANYLRLYRKGINEQ